LLRIPQHLTKVGVVLEIEGIEFDGPRKRDIAIQVIGE